MPINPLSILLEFSASKIEGVTLDDFVGSFSTNTNPTLVFLTTKQIAEMHNSWMKARNLLLADGQTICCVLSSPNSSIVHMLDGCHFDIIDQAARLIKYNISQPFGGLQVLSPFLCCSHIFIILQVIAAGHFSKLSDTGTDFVFPFRAKAWAYTFNQLSTTVNSILSSNSLRFLIKFRHLTPSPSHKLVALRKGHSQVFKAKTVRKGYLQIKQGLLKPEMPIVKLARRST